MAKHRKVRAGSNDRLSARTWNGVVDFLNSPKLANGSKLPLPSIMNSSAIVSASSGTLVNPFTPVRVLSPINFNNPPTGNFFEVDSVSSADDGTFEANSFWKYGFTLSEGVSQSGGGRVVVGGIAIVRVSRTSLTGPSGYFDNANWHKLYYNVPDDTCGSSLIGPTGHYRIIGVWEASKLYPFTSANDDVYLAIDLDSQPSSILVSVGVVYPKSG